MPNETESIHLEDIKILIVEDDVFIAAGLKISLENLGYTVAEPCLTVSDAINVLKTESFDLAILDLNFYGKEEGTILGKHIKRDYNIPFIYLTAFSDPATVSKATMTSPSAYLVKPASSGAVFAAIQTALHNYSNHSVAIGVENNLEKDSFFIKNRGSIHQVLWQDIAIVEASKNYAILTVNGNPVKRIALRGTLINVIRIMPTTYSQNFLQVNKSCFVNIKLIVEITNSTVCVINRHLPLSKIYRNNVINSLNIL